MSHLTRPGRLAAVVSLALLVVPLEPVFAQQLVVRLCEATDWQTRMGYLPRIDSILFNNVTPGGFIFLKGRGLHNTTALTLKLTDFGGTPREFGVQLLDGGDTFCRWRLGSIVGITDQSAILQTRNSSNQFSNEFTVKFTAEDDSHDKRGEVNRSTVIRPRAPRMPVRRALPQLFFRHAQRRGQTPCVGIVWEFCGFPDGDSE